MKKVSAVWHAVQTVFSHHRIALVQFPSQLTNLKLDNMWSSRVEIVSSSSPCSLKCPKIHILWYINKISSDISNTVCLIEHGRRFRMQFPISPLSKENAQSCQRAFQTLRMCFQTNYFGNRRNYFRHGTLLCREPGFGNIHKVYWSPTINFG